MPTKLILVTVVVTLLSIRSESDAAAARSGTGDRLNSQRADVRFGGINAPDPIGTIDEESMDLEDIGPDARFLPASLISWAIKKGIKQVTKGQVTTFINQHIKAKLKHLAQRKLAKKFTEQADKILEALDDPWWLTAVGFIPIVGDALDLGRVPLQIRRALHAADELEAAVNRTIARRFGWSSLSRTTIHLIDHLDVKVSVYVGKFRKGSIRRVLPSEVLDMTIAEALEHSSTARKLLVKGEYAR